ncbi:nuclear transport factor 2 family protein [Vibrio astriarenae]|uniref:Nuclear transport factor 2 family protein n=1 Tax=Vibrio astriarenae TaxID=1481923 RepID=A0A7Z2T282_9VIBR|nr:nuclear transport factor 2 family protein [Vibrio astriarenae]QIA62921.1 nuclear transport factor 2 family protein [Vibrio astriarenae]
MDVASVADFYQRLGKNNLDTLGEIYHNDVVFEDPAHKLSGLNSLEAYFHSMYSNVNSCHFEILSADQVDQRGYIKWLMTLSHPKLSSGNSIEVEGLTFVEFRDGKVIHHRDYFDLGAMLYEHLPLLGRVVSTIRRKLGQA